MRGSIIASALVLTLAAGSAAAEEPVAPSLGAASNFGQGWRPDILEAAGALPVTLFRDAVYWSEVERRGRYRFNQPRTTFPGRLPERGAGMAMIVNWGHPDYDDGYTPFTPESREAFGAYAAEAVRRWPAVEAVEVGNEMNAQNFIAGPVWDVGLSERAVLYAELLAATAEAVRAVRPEVEIMGGAGHSISLTWFEALSRAGAPAHMDAVVVHPYNVPPEMLARKFERLRAVPGFEDMPLAITEIGVSDAETAPGFLLRTYCQIALAGASHYVWYPLHPRGDGMAPLVTQEGEVTAAGRAYALVEAEFAGAPVEAIAPDPFTYGCRFGDQRAVVWGASRALEVDEASVTVRDASGAPMDPQALQISPTKPLVLAVEDGVLEAGVNWRLGPQSVISDSYHQFTFDQDAALEAGGWARGIRTANGRVALLEARPGQQRGGVPWDPHLGAVANGDVFADAGLVVPAMTGAGPDEVFLQHRVQQDVRAVLEIEFGPAARALPFPDVRVRRGGAVVLEQFAEGRARLRLGPLDLAEGEILEVAVGPNGTPTGNLTGVTARLLHAAE